jgi:hypothetical protein
VLEHHPVADPAAVTAPRVARGELRRFTAAALVQHAEPDVLSFSFILTG